MEAAWHAWAGAHRLEALVLDQIDTAVIGQDLNGVITHWNAQAEKLYGWKREEVIGRGFLDVGIVPMSGAELSRCLTARVIADGGFELDVERRRKDGTPVLVTLKGRPLRAPDGSVIGIVGISNDVTEQRRMEAALKRRNAELLRAERIAGLASWTWNLRRDAIRLSENGVRVFGLSELDLGRTSSQQWLSTWVHPDDREKVRSAVRTALEGGAETTLEFRIVMPDGSIRHASCAAEIETDDEGRPVKVHGTVQDVTARRQAEQALSESERAARKLLARLMTAQDDERRRIASDIHDDVLQALNAVALRAETLATHLGDAAHAATVRTIEGGVRDAIEGLRHLAAGMRLPGIESVDLVPALQAYLKAATTDWPVRHRVEGELTEEPCIASRAAIYRIAVEALVNARKHSAANEVTVRVKSRDGGVRMTVTDNGDGFRPADVDLYDGGHFGLAGMKERAESAGGWCRLHSSPGSGTRVEAWLPCVHVAA
jgi:PAS domain S-box-containing protein